MNHIICDTRELPAPEPFEVVVEALKKLQKGQYLTMVHRKIPKLLLPILNKMQMSYLLETLDEELFHIHIYYTDEEEYFHKVHP